MKPSTIIRIQNPIATSETQTRYCVTFQAIFENGEVKYLNLFQWIDNRLLKEYEMGSTKVILSPSECTLYFRDWSENPVYGDFNRNYPKLPKLGDLIDSENNPK